MSKHAEHHHDQECDCKEGECNCGEECTCGGECHCGCDCCQGGHFQRRYMTKAEQIAELETYLGELKLEVQAVEENLADLRK
jgi:hypothetical protein